MSKELIRIEAMQELLYEVGVKLTDEQVKKITTDFCFHLEMEREIDSYATSGIRIECEKCSSLKSQISELKKENDIFRNSVKQRRKASSVWIQGDEVMYEK